MSRYELHSEDGSRVIRRTPNGWELMFDWEVLGYLETREEARTLIRALKTNPDLLPIIQVQLS